MQHIEQLCKNNKYKLFFRPQQKEELFIAAIKIFTVEQNVIILNICCFVTGHINMYFLGGKNVFPAFTDKNNQLDTP